MPPIGCIGQAATPCGLAWESSQPTSVTITNAGIATVEQRRSIEQLAAPICDSCNVEIAWSRSALVADEQAIVHVFICPRCGGVVETKTPMKASKE